MKAKTSKSIILGFMLCIVLSVFTGCVETTSNEIRGAACILYGNTKNVCLPNSNDLKNEIAQMAEKGTSCSLIVIDGDAEKVSYKSRIKYPDSFEIFKSDNNHDYINGIIEDIDKAAKPKSKEIDIINGLYNASKFLAKENVSDKRIILFSSGISTKGPLNFSQNPDLINQKPQDIVDMLNADNALPNLEGITVVWHGLGVVEAPQNKLGMANEKKLEEIWNTILKACKATIYNDSVVADVNAVGDYDINMKKGDYPDVSIAAFNNVIVFDNKTVEFIKDTAEFLDEEKVYKELKPYAQLILESNCQSFYLIGSTASIGDYEKCRNLSVQRAKAVKKVLCGFGVPDTYFGIYGIGRMILPGWRENDLNSEGILNNKAQLNRKVMLVEKDSKEGKEFIRIWNEMKNNND